MSDSQYHHEADTIQEVNTMPSNTPNPVRYHYMDNLRAVAMLAGVLFHAALAYSTFLHSAWATADTSSSRVVDFFVWLPHTFRMPLFFLISGFFACLLIQKRGGSAYLKNRSKRILLPFVVFWPICLIAIFATVGLLASKTEVDSFIVNLVRQAMQNPEQNQQNGNGITTMHLWFLFNLMLFCFATFVLERYFSISEKLMALLTHPATLLVGAPVITAFALLPVAMPHPPAEKFYPELWAVVFYGGFFFVGWLYFRKPELLQRIEKYWLLLLLTSAASYAVFFYLLPVTITPEQLMSGEFYVVEQNTSHWVQTFCTSQMAWHLSFLSLIAAKRFFDWKNDVMRYVTDSSYWVYIMHLPVLMAIQGGFNLLHWPLVIELCLSIILTLAVCVLSYHVMVRNSFIGVLLNGKRHRKMPNEVQPVESTPANTKESVATS